MRRRHGRLALLAAAALAGACLHSGTDAPTPPCEPDGDCLRTERGADGTCDCVEWRIESIRPVPVSFVVVGVAYPPLGSAGAVTYGFTSALHVPDPEAVEAAADFGAHWRARALPNDGIGHVPEPAAVGPWDPPWDWMGWGPLAAVTEQGAVFAFAQAGCGADACQDPIRTLTLLGGPADVPSHANDQLFVWLNPTAVVMENAVSELTVAWSWRQDCADPRGCYGPTVVTLLAGWLDGSLAAPTGIQPILDGLGAEDRAAILAYDPFYDPPGRAPAVVVADARFQRLTTVQATAPAATTPSVRWVPCDNQFFDQYFDPMKAWTNAEGSLVIEHTAFSSWTMCRWQYPGVRVQSATPGCTLSADLYVDTMFGSVLAVPTDVGATCAVE